MFYLFVGCAEHLYTELIQRVVVAAAHAHRPPSIAALHLSRQSSLFGLATVVLLLRLVFQLEQEALLL